MALEEISANTPRSNHDSSGKNHARDNTNSSHVVPPLAVQNMLRTQTELGNLNQFARRPSRTHRSRSRAYLHDHNALAGRSPHPSILDRDTTSAIRRIRRHAGPRPTVSMTALSSRPTPHRYRSSRYAPPRYQDGIPHRQRYQYPPPQAAGHPSLPTLYSYPALISTQSRQDLLSIRSSSPIPYNLYLRHTMSTPAYGDRSMFSRGGSLATMALSNASSFHQGFSGRGIYPGLNGSQLSLQTMSSPFGPPGYTNSPGSHFSLRRSHTPHVPGFEHAVPHHRFVSRSDTQSRGNYSIPDYYDYSESFLEDQDGGMLQLDERESNVTPQPYMVPGRKNAQSPFGTVPGSAFQPAELQGSHNRRPSIQSKHSFKGVIPRRTSSLYAASLLCDSRTDAGTARSICPTPDIPNLKPQLIEESNLIPELTAETLSEAGHRIDDDNRLTCPNLNLPAETRTEDAVVTGPLPGYYDEVDIFESKDTSEQDISGSGEMSTHAIEHEHKDVMTRVSSNWELPSFSFLPLSPLLELSALKPRPRTSEGSHGHRTLMLWSPTPERPMSSQSRKRFSRILDLHEDPSTSATSASRKTFQTLGLPSSRILGREFADNDRIEQPVTPVSTMRRCRWVFDELKAVSEKDAESPGAMIMSPDKSTIESLLDRHIEALGLSPEDQEMTHAHLFSAEGNDSMEMSASTIRVMKLLLLESDKQDQTVRGLPSERPTSLTSSDRQKLVPARLFARNDEIPSPEQLVSEAPSDTDIDERLKEGWQRLASTSELDSLPWLSKPSLLSGELGDIDTQERRHKFRIGSYVNSGEFAPTPTRRHHSMTALSEHKKNPQVHRRSRSDVAARQTSRRRRKIRIRINPIKQNMTSRSNVDGMPDHRLPERNQPVILSSGMVLSNTTISVVDGFAELDGDGVQCRPSCVPSPKSLATQPAKVSRASIQLMRGRPSVDRGISEVTRNLSMKSLGSHRGQTNLADPVNCTTRTNQSAAIESFTAPIRFNTPITSSDLNLSIPYSELPPPIQSLQREKESGLQKRISRLYPKESIRRKYQLSGFGRGTLHVFQSPENIKSTIPALSKLPTGQCRPMQYHHTRSSSPEIVVPMSNFAYKKRRVFERMKEWWRKQCVQKRLEREKR